jgi:hypothetical protein
MIVVGGPWSLFQAHTNRAALASVDELHPASSNQSFPGAWAAEAIGDILHNDINDLRQGRGAGGLRKIFFGSIFPPRLR